MPNIIGTPGNDVLNGTASDDVIQGLAGNDTISDLLGGQDNISGGDNDDVITVARSATGSFGSISGDAGADIIRLIGIAGTISGSISGGDGDDSVFLDFTSKSAGPQLTIDLGAGNDLVSLITRTPSPYQMTVTTGTGSDTIGGPAVITDFTTGNGGDHLLWNESLAMLWYWDQSTNPFASGDMRLVTSGPNPAIEVMVAEWKVFTYLLGVNAATLTTFNLGGYALDGSAPANQTLTGTGAGERIEGGLGNDTISGGAGNDTLLGGIGNDTINGEGDDDVIDGGLGNDTIDGGNGNDVITDHYGRQGTIAGGAGNDTITVDLTLNVLLGAQPAAPPTYQRTIDGGADNDVIRFITSDSLASASPNYSGATISGGTGDDYIETNSHKVTIDGGAGHDTIVVVAETMVTLGADSDILRLNTTIGANAFSVTVTDFQAGAGGDVFDLPAFLLLNPYGWNYEGNPFATGEIRLLTSGTDVLVQGKTGAPQGGGYTTFLILQATSIAAFTAENFAGYAPAGTPPADQVILGTPGPDTLNGGLGNDTISGLGDNDTITGGFGADHLIGGEGNDVLEDRWGSDTLEGGNGNDTLRIIRDIITPASTLTLDGGDGNDIISFTRAPTTSLATPTLGTGTILGGLGNDVITTEYFSGTIDGGDGNDQLTATFFSGTITLGAGDDVLAGSTLQLPSTQIDMGAGNDLILLHGIYALGSSGNITLGAGMDIVITDRNRGEAEILDFQAGEAGDRLDLTSWGANPFGVGGPLIISQNGADVYIAEQMLGTFYILRNVAASDLSTYNLGVPTGFFNPQGRTYNGTPADDTYVSADGADVLNGLGANDRLYGAGGNDQINGGDGNDVLFGGSGMDQLNGGADNDVLDGGLGADQMAGGSGDDSYYVDNSGDVVSESAGQGRDVVYTGVNYELAAGAEIEVLSADDQGATVALQLVGNALNQEIYGNAGANLLEGGGGNDFLIGLGGDDLYIVNGNQDRVVEVAGQGRDVVYTRGDYVLDPSVSVEILSTVNQAATTAINLTGSTGDQEIYGNAGANVLDGGGGTDYMGGLGGNDTYFVNGAGDHVIEAVGGGSRDVVYARASYALEANQEVEVLSAASQSATTAMSLTGNNLANEIYGNNGANTINGGAGSDYLMGFGGADTFAFTTALGAGNVDQILDFAVVDDTIALDDAVFAGLAPGALAPGAFVNGTAALDADDRILYNSATGQILFDADGNGAGAAVLFATVSAGTALTASDFTVI